MGQHFLPWIVLTVILSNSSESANILGLFPTASYSHEMPLLSVARALAERGHNVTVITTKLLETPIPNYTEIDISFTYNFWKPKEGEKKAVVNFSNRMGPIEMVKMYVASLVPVMEAQFNSTNVQKFIKYIDREKPKFDLVLHEDLMHTSYLGFVHKLGYPPVVGILTLPLTCSSDLVSGNICNPSYVPDFVMGHTNRMTFWERLENYFLYFYMHIIINPSVRRGQDYLAGKYFGVTSPTVHDILRNKSLTLTSSTWFLQYPRPVFPNTILVGPVQIGETKPLPKDLQNWIDGAKEGVIYFSLGSNVKSKSLDENKRPAIMAAFARFPSHRVIWKFEDEKLPDLPSNVICRKWLPQHDLLANPNIKLFITQGGLQSLHEAVYFQVPTIGIPFFADQIYNVKIIKSRGIGNYMYYDEINTETLYNVMSDILYNKSYMDNVKRISEISKTQMMSPRDSTIWWIEYVLKCKGDVRHLQPDYWHLTWYQYFGLDVLLFALSPVLIILFGLYKLILTCRNRLSKDKIKKH